MAGKSLIFRFGDVEVREPEFSLTKAGEVLPVEPKAFRVLLILLRNHGKLISKDELLNAVWGDAAVTENSLTRSIALLRRLLGDDSRNPRFIETVATVGYRMVCKVEVAEDASGALKPTGETPQDATAADAVVISPEQADQGVGGESTSAHLKENGRKRLARLLLSAAVVLAVGIAAATRYLHRPLPQLRITGYTQITHDGHEKDLVGTDGSRLYFNGSGIQQVSTTGGEIAPIPIAAGLEDVSPDGSSLLVAKGGDGVTQASSLWNARVLGGSLRRLGDGVDATFSPDGNSVAYSTPKGDIYDVGSNGTDARKLASVGGEAYSLAWSPDGRTIRFTRDNRLWETSSSGSNLHQLFPSWHASAQQCCGRWTEDGRFFLFLSGESIWKMDTDQPGSPGGRDLGPR
jgi:DNA-binding winged helix-turn-helix (wHTH) protein